MPKKPGHRTVSVSPSKERRERKRFQAVSDVYLAGQGMVKRFKARNHSADGVFLELCADSLKGLTPGSELELVFVFDRGRLVRLQRRKAVVSHLSEDGAGLQLCRS